MSGRSENPRIFDCFQSELPASVAPGLELVRGAPKRLFLAAQTVDVRARAAKMCGGSRTRQAVLLDRHAFPATVH